MLWGSEANHGCRRFYDSSRLLADRLKVIGSCPAHAHIGRGSIFMFLWPPAHVIANILFFFCFAAVYIFTSISLYFLKPRTQKSEMLHCIRQIFTCRIVTLRYGAIWSIMRGHPQKFANVRSIYLFGSKVSEMLHCPFVKCSEDGFANVIFDKGLLG